jgi:hypothetical protein
MINKHTQYWLRQKCKTDCTQTYCDIFYVLLTVYLSVSFDKEQLDAHLLYFILQYAHYNPLHVSSIDAHHQEVNCIDQHLVSSS